jgi:SAM-dependent methyltransferase/tetratricopeptide (TPR) repeat protein
LVKREPIEKRRPGARGSSANPLKEALDHFNAGRMQDAENLLRLVLMTRPNDGDALNMLAGIALQRGNVEAARDALERAAQSQPKNAWIRVNLAGTYRRLAENQKAIEQYEQAIALQPGLAEAHAQKGDALRDLGRWEEAGNAYRTALGHGKTSTAAQNGHAVCLLHDGDAEGAVAVLSGALSAIPPQNKAARAGILANLGRARLRLGSAVEGLSALTEAAILQPDNTEIARALAHNLQHVRTVPGSDTFRIVLLRLLMRSDVDPRALATAVVATLKNDRAFSQVLDRVAQTSGEIDPSDLNALSANTLFMTLLTRAPVPDAAVERALTSLRRRLLLAVASGRRDECAPALGVAVALARQCFLNEYVYGVAAAEADALSAMTGSPDEEGGETDWFSLALTACYRPLSECSKEMRARAPAPFSTLFRQHVDEPAEEREIAKTIEVLTSVTDGVSAAVQAQYEENPYPRWVGHSGDTKLPFRQALRERLPHVDDARIPGTDTPRVLIAGCGTGLETMRVVTSYRTDSVLAVDLSRASLAYGMRKLAAYGIENVEYRQADILELGGLDRKFDFIDSFGVIHHMAAPEKGLEVLAGLLEPGGVLFLGLYSTIARRAVTEARALIAERGLTSSAEAIREFRQELLHGDAPPALAPLASPASDFWTMSECRDLMFHVEEHCFTLKEITDLFRKTGLEFLGLEVPHAPDLTLFREENPAQSSLSSLEAWHIFEERHPETFGGTYRLWVRKPVS